MVTYFTVLSLWLLTLAVTQGCCAENQTLVETQTALNWTLECEQYTNLEEIKAVVQAYINNTDWETLQRDLGAVLDNSSVEYRQLQQAESLLTVGWYNSTQLPTLLLCAGLPVDTAGSDGDTMLFGAAVDGHLELVKLLVQRGADVDVGGNHGRAPIIYAASHGHLDVVQYLVQAGADTTVRNQWGYNALYYARLGDFPELIRYLQQLPQ